MFPGDGPGKISSTGGPGQSAALSHVYREEDKMRKKTVVWMILAVCFGAFVMVIFYHHNQSKTASPVGSKLTQVWRKSIRSPLQALYATVPTDSSPLHLTHQARRELLQASCRWHTHKRRVLNPEDLRHVIVDDQHGLLYCYVPKVACTNWKRVMLVLTGESGLLREPLQIPANEAHSPGRLRTLSDYSAPEINRRLRTYLKFLFVREPFERLVSAYRNKFTRSYNTAFHRRYGTRTIQKHRHAPSPQALELGDDVSFAEFVRYLVDPGTRREEPFNEHWERAHALCHPCLIGYDVVGKYETLNEDAAYVLNLAGVDSDVTFPSSAHKVRTTGDMTSQFFNSISPEYQRKLFDLYSLDFLLFNYSIPAYLQLS